MALDFAPAETGQSEAPAQRPLGWGSFLGFAVISFGGPLALAGLIAPSVITSAGRHAGDSAGLAILIGAVVFTVPMLIWLRYSRDVQGSGGLYDFVKAAAGPRVALVQAAVWTVSYLLYIVYTTTQIVYDLLPDVFPGVRSIQTPLQLLIPVVLAAVMIGGRRSAMVTAGALAVVQLALVGTLAAVTVANIGVPASSFGAGAPAGVLAKAGFQTSLLYVCGSLPLFLGGELRRPATTIRRGLSGVFALTVVLILLAVAPLAATPGLLHSEVPGVAVAQRYVGTGLADAIGVGLALSIGGVMLAEYFALTRLLHTAGGWRLRSVTLTVGAIIVAAAPLMLINPDGLYDALIKPSLIALWLSQLIVFAVYPRFAKARGQRMLTAWALSLFASGLVIYGLVITIQHAAS